MKKTMLVSCMAICLGVVTLYGQSENTGPGTGFTAAEIIAGGGDMVTDCLQYCSFGYTNNPTRLKDQTGGGGNPAETAQIGITAGLVLDGLGSLLYVIGGALSSEDLTTSMRLTIVGSYLLTAGGIVGNISYATRTDAYYRAGYDVSGVPAGLSWLLCIGSAACTVGGSLLGLTAGTEDFDAALAAYIIVVGGGLLECFNLMVRSTDWDTALAKAPRRQARADAVWRVKPVMCPVSTASGFLMTPGMALAVDF